MPLRKLHRRKRPLRRAIVLQNGKGFLDSMKKIGKAIGKANKFLRKSKIVSKASGALASAGLPYASKIHQVSSQLGYGVLLPGAARPGQGGRGKRRKGKKPGPKRKPGRPRKYR